MVAVTVKFEDNWRDTNDSDESITVNNRQVSSELRSDWIQFEIRHFFRWRLQLLVWHSAVYPRVGLELGTQSTKHTRRQLTRNIPGVGKAKLDSGRHS